MKAHLVEHRAARLKPGGIVRGITTRWSAACSCGWSGPMRVTRERADSDYRGHVQRQAAELREAIEIDRAAGLDAEVDL